MNWIAPFVNRIVPSLIINRAIGALYRVGAKQNRRYDDYTGMVGLNEQHRARCRNNTVC
jgi:hypothetical protein